MASLGMNRCLTISPHGQGSDDPSDDKHPVRAVRIAADVTEPLLTCEALLAAAACACVLVAACSSQGGHEAEALSRAAHIDGRAACLPGERGYLRASLRGSIDTELDWRGADLQCEGGARPEDRGVRMSFRGPVDAQGRRLRLVFGMAVLPGATVHRATPTNITVIVEGRNQIYATQGDDRCTVEAVAQEPLPSGMPAADRTADRAADRTADRVYRVAARGYCIDPAATLDGSGHLYINRFDFAGQASFEDNEIHAIAAHVDAPLP